ncbi:MAG TPA: Tol-Pal system beta propeller repeat protein TolB [Gammaproteobacteria bacterium]|nr:Tol-Pal system beta propeller repeat protein TolB [Gammaproteobacteria bacterium]
MTHRISLLFIGLLWLLAAPVHAELRIEITQGVSEAVPIAVVPFGFESQGTPSVDVAAVIDGDLAFSGRFDPMDRIDMVAKPTRPEDVKLEDWRLLKTDIVVVGRIKPAGPGRYEIEFHVFDVFRGQPLMGYSLPAAANNLRAAGHRIADMIYERLTGVPGIFSTRIAYVTVDRHEDKPRYRLWLADADGGRPNVIAESAQPIMSPAWSPDSRRIAYVSFETGVSKIFVQDIATGRRQAVSSHSGINSAPAWSPDGTRLALVLGGKEGDLDIHVLTLASKELRRVTRHPAIDTEPSWAPDGRSIYFTSDRAGGPQVYQVGLDGANPRRITFEGPYNARPRVSPDGEQLAVVHNDRGNFRIALLDLRRGGLRILSDGRQDESPSFAPNGSMIIYGSRAGGRGILAAVSSDGRVRQRIAATEGDVREPVWAPYAR